LDTGAAVHENKVHSRVCDVYGTAGSHRGPFLWGEGGGSGGFCGGVNAAAAVVAVVAVIVVVMVMLSHHGLILGFCLFLLLTSFHTHARSISFSSLSPQSDDLIIDYNVTDDAYLFASVIYCEKSVIIAQVSITSWVRESAKEFKGQ
jgi:hypothetical protein